MPPLTSGLVHYRDREGALYAFPPGADPDDLGFMRVGDYWMPTSHTRGQIDHVHGPLTATKD